jgi:hypothetical protein
MSKYIKKSPTQKKSVDYLVFIPNKQGFILFGDLDFETQLKNYSKTEIAHANIISI